jgi:DNA-binding transcriptional LysR family regulator
MNVTVRQLRAFIAVADAGSFTDGAKRLHLTQSALSLLVKELEEELGVRLLDRSTRRTRLSAAGSDFYPLAAKVLEDLESAVASTRELRDKQRGSVRVACTLLYAAALMPQILASYRSEYPGVRVRMLDSLNEDVLARVASGEADFGVAPQRPTSPELVEAPLFKDRIDLICPAGHPLARRGRVTWEQALRFPFVSLTRDFTARLQADLFAASPGLALQPVHEVSYLTTALGMVRHGHGITALPSASSPLVEAFGLAVVPAAKPIVHRQVSLFVRRGQSLSPAAASLRDFLSWHVEQQR